MRRWPRRASCTRAVRLPSSWQRSRDGSPGSSLRPADSEPGARRGRVDQSFEFQPSGGCSSFWHGFLDSKNAPILSRSVGLNPRWYFETSGFELLSGSELIGTRFETTGSGFETTSPGVETVTPGFSLMISSFGDSTGLDNSSF